MAENAFTALLQKVGSGATPWKDSVRTVATTNHALTGLQTLSGVLVEEGDPVLETGRTNPAENGKYTASAGAWVRTPDMASSTYLKLATTIKVREGTGAGTWALTAPTNGEVRVGVTQLTFTKEVISTYLGPVAESLEFNAVMVIDFDGVTDVEIEEMTENVEFDSPSNLVEGGLYTVKVLQDSGGFNYATFNGGWNFPDGLELPCLKGGESTTWLFRAQGGELHCIGRTYSVGYVSFTSGAPNLVPGIVNILSGTVANPTVPDGSGWGGMANGMTVKLANLTGGAVINPSGSDTLNGAATYTISNVYGDAVILSRGTTALLVSPGV